MAVFFSVVSKMVSNIDIFQGIVSKLVIPVSWQHYFQDTLNTLLKLAFCNNNFKFKV